MITGKDKMKNYRRAKKTIDVSVGESVRIIQELQELSQNDLAELTSIPQSTISAIENDRVRGCRACKGSRNGLEVSSAGFPGMGN